MSWVMPAAFGVDALSNLLGPLLGGNSGPAQIDPAIQAALQGRGLDISQAAQESSMRNNMFNQNSMAALQNAYNQNYGGAEKAASQLAQYGAMLAPQQQQLQQDTTQNLLSSGVDMASPFSQYLMAQANQNAANTYGMGASNIINQQAQAGIGNAMDILKMGQTSNRLAGVELPTDSKVYDDQISNFQRLLQNKDASPFLRSMWSAALKNAVAGKESLTHVNQPNNYTVPTWSTPGTATGPAVSGQAGNSNVDYGRYLSSLAPSQREQYQNQISRAQYDYMNSATPQQRQNLGQYMDQYQKNLLFPDGNTSRASWATRS
jgi:hypothetical protein